MDQCVKLRNDIIKKREEIKDLQDEVFNLRNKLSITILNNYFNHTVNHGGPVQITGMRDNQIYLSSGSLTYPEELFISDWSHCCKCGNEYKGYIHLEEKICPTCLKNKEGGK